MNIFVGTVLSRCSQVELISSHSRTRIIEIRRSFHPPTISLLIYHSEYSAELSRVLSGLRVKILICTRIFVGYKLFCHIIQCVYGKLHLERIREFDIRPVGPISQRSWGRLRLRLTRELKNALGEYCRTEESKTEYKSHLLIEFFRNLK